jgi:hypothetical protein
MEYKVTMITVIYLNNSGGEEEEDKEEDKPPISPLISQRYKLTDAEKEHL